MRISKALTEAGGNFARPTRYKALIVPPPSLIIDFINSEKLDLLCKTFQIPSVNNEAYEIKIKGQIVKIPGRTNQSKELTLTFYVDDAYSVRKLFQDWIEGLDKRFQGKRNLQTSAMITLDDKYGFITLSALNYTETETPIIFFFEDVYPTSVGELEFDTSNKDSITELSVTFAYSRFNTHNIANKSINAIEGLDDTFNGVN